MIERRRGYGVSGKQHLFNGACRIGCIGSYGIGSKKYMEKEEKGRWLRLRV